MAGIVGLKIENKGESIAGFFIDNDMPTKEYYTKIYKNYFLSFLSENNNKYLIIEQAQFGKEFALTDNGNAIIGDKNNKVEIQITNAVHEWGYDGPPEDENRNYFSGVQYTLKIKVKDVVKNFNFYSSDESKEDVMIEVEGCCVQILSDIYKD